MREVFALAKGDIPIYEDELFSSLSVDTINKIDFCIRFLSNANWSIRNRNVCKKITGYPNLYELRPKNVRLFFFMIVKNAYITHGYVKKENKTDPGQIKRALHLKSEAIQE
jgi:hypothetical protein